MKTLPKTQLLSIFTLAACAAPGAAQRPAQAGPPPAFETPARHEARMRWWREARFGMFVHRGFYSGLAGTWDGKPVAAKGGMEWIQQRVGADTESYGRRAGGR
jgi:alpha-L-fucosidase